MTPQEFSQKIKAKYPEYKNVDDTQLAKSIVQKYPQYQQSVNFGQSIQTPQKSTGQKVLDAGTAVSDALGFKGTTDYLGNIGANLAHPGLGSKGYIPQPTLKQSIGAGAQIGSTIASIASPIPAGVAANIGQGALLGSSAAGGASLAQGSNLGQAGTDAARGGILGGAIQGAFKLLGKGVAYLAGKTGPTALSFTSGVPKNAIQQAAQNPVAAKQGLKMSVREVRDQAVTSLDSLYSDLGNEFETGLQKIGPTQANTTNLAPTLFQKARTIAEDYNVAVKGIAPDFSKSAIVSGGEQRAVSEAFNTLKSWDDFSAQGMQNLSTRIGALKNWDEAGATRSSAIVGKIYNAVGDAINTNYPELGQLKTNYSVNRELLDNIKSVLSANKDDPKAIQASVSRLDNLFKENRDEYLNIVKQLGDKSGVDYLSLLAGGEFQKLLPGFIRGVGGGAAVAVGSQALNPYLWLLAPLFSPRMVGAITRNASGVLQTGLGAARAGTTQAIQALAPQGASAPQGQASQGKTGKSSQKPITEEEARKVIDMSMGGLGVAGGAPKLVASIAKKAGPATFERIGEFLRRWDTKSYDTKMSLLDNYKNFFEKIGVDHLSPDDLVRVLDKVMEQQK